MHSRFRPPAFATLLYLGAPAIALADVITVGPACQYADLQAAINATHGNVNELHVHADYRGKPVRISNKTLHIYGGYPSCNASAPIPFTGNAQDLSWLDGSLDSGAKPVIAIDGQASLDLRNFFISDGHNDGHNGGGIQFNSSGDFGHLELHAVEINGNRADKGGGIFFHGGAATDELFLYDYSLIRNNTAHDAGGGIRLEGNTYLRANSPQTIISDNTADPSNGDDGAGGGLQLLDETITDIGSPGFNGDAVIFRNHARNGGGIAMMNDAQAYLYTTVAGAPARVENNDALEGAGLHLNDGGHVCVGGAGINRNHAVDGAAIHTDSASQPHEHSSSMTFRRTCNRSMAVACTTGMACNTIDANYTESGGNSIITVRDGSSVRDMRTVAIRHNVAASIFDTTTAISCSTCEISGNATIDGVLVNRGTERTTFSSCTIAANAIAGSTVLSGQAPVTLNNTILWQPGKQSLGDGSLNNVYSNVIVADLASVDPGRFDILSNVLDADPAFIDLPGGNLHLKATSFAVDFAPAGTEDSLDLDNRSRPVDLVEVPGGPFDIGAYEVQEWPIPVTFPPVENFDELGQTPTLPSEWSEGHNGDNPGWEITSIGTDTGPYAAHVKDQQGFADLITPFVHIDAPMRLTFRHHVRLGGNTTVDNDAVTLFVNVDGSLFTVLQTGGRFTRGAPNACHGQCWTGDHSEYETVTAELPSSLIGKTVRFYWSFGYLGDNPGVGYWLDSITLESSDSIFVNGFDP